VDQGFGPFGAREIAKAPETTGTLVAEIVAARFVLAAGAYVLVLVLALSLDRPPVVTELLLIYSLSLFGMPLLLQWVFQGHDRMNTVAVLQLVRQTVFAAVVFAFVRGLDQLRMAGVAEVAGVISAAAFGLWMYRRQLGGIWRPRLALYKRPFIEGLPIGLSQMFWTVRMFGATLILGLIAPPEDVGFFASAMRILVAAHTFVWLYYFNLLPSMSRAWQRQDGSFARLIDRSLRNVAWLGLLGGFAWVALARPAVSLVYGPAFTPASSTLQLLAGVCVMALLSGHYRFGLIAAGRQQLEMASSALGALVAVPLIPAGYALAGLPGVAICLLAAEAIVWLSAWHWARSRIGLAGHLRLLTRPLLASVFAFGLLWVLMR
jgi:PST family polysaccharide transporter